MLVREVDCHLCFQNRGEPIQTILQMWDIFTGKSEISLVSFFYMANWLVFRVFKQRNKENHLFKWVDEALVDEIQRMDEDQTRITEEIEDLRSSMKKTVHEEVMKHTNSLDVGCVASILSILCLCSKCDWCCNFSLIQVTFSKIEPIWFPVLSSCSEPMWK